MDAGEEFPGIPQNRMPTIKNAANIMQNLILACDPKKIITMHATIAPLENEKRKAAETINAEAIECNITDWLSVKRATETSINSSERIDILVNSAGIAGPNETVVNYDNEAWDQIISVNLTGTYYVNKSVVPYMKTNGYGRIVNIASVAGKDGNPNASAYSASKAGVIALTKSLGKELADSNIAVNCVTPAAARTAIFDQMSQEHIDYMLSKIPRNRFAKVNELASLVSWLASEENSFSTAAVFDLSGGRATY